MNTMLPATAPVAAYIQGLSVPVNLRSQQGVDKPITTYIVRNNADLKHEIVNFCITVLGLSDQEKIN